jgi:ornithine decarboxylase
MLEKVKIFKKDFDLESIVEKESKNSKNSFYICNLSDVIRKYRDWCRYLPRIQLHYAMKCNDNSNVLKILAALGSNYDCASKGEIEKILELNVDPERIIFANPIKYPGHIEFAKNRSVKKMTFDNEDELFKLKDIYPDAE